MRGALVVCVVSLLGCGPQDPPLQFGPCQPERVSHVEGFGFFGSPAYIDEISQSSTFVWGSIADAAQADAAGLRAVVDVSAIFEIVSPSRPPDDEVERAWASAVEQLRPLRGAIAALYPIDEPYSNARQTGVPFEEVARRLEHAAQVVHATAGFEDVPMAVIFANPELDWIAAGEARNPSGYTWVGFDHYFAKPARLEERAALLLALLRPEQRVLVVPDAFLLSHEADQLAGLEGRIAFWLGWVERNPRAVAIAPYVYTSGTYQTTSWIGARDLPTIRDRYAQIGHCIAQAAVARGTSAASASTR